MAGIDDDIENEGAIDTGDDTMQAAQSAGSPSPPISGDQGPTQAAPNPLPNQLPNMGPPPLAQGAAQESMGAGVQKTGQAISRDIGQGIENFKQSGPAQVTKRIVSYLMGTDAENPAALDQAGAAVDPHRQMSPGDRNLIAIDKAAETGGQEAAWKLLQANRVAFNAKQAFARTALHGIQGKPADINAAIDAANQAEQHIPDGSNVKFSPSQNGVTATVTMPGTSQTQQIPLTTEQFDKWLDVGGDGQWDKAHQASVPATLQRLSQGGAGAGAGQSTMSKVTGVPDNGPPAGPMPQLRQDQQPGGYDPNQPEGPGGQYQGEDDGRVKPAPGTMFNPPRDRAAQRGEPGYSEAAHLGRPIVHSMNAGPNAPHGLPGYNDDDPNPMGDQPAFRGTHDENGHWLGPKTKDTTNYGDELEARSRRIFPGVGQEAERQQWMGTQEEKELERGNKLGVAAETGKNRIEAARQTGAARVQGAQVTAAGHVQGAQATATGRVDAAKLYSSAREKTALANLQARVQQQEAIGNRSQAVLQEKALGTILATGGTLNPQQQKVWDRIIANTPAPSAQQQPAAGQGSLQRPANVPPGAKSYQGKWYTRGPNGESVPVQ